VSDELAAPVVTTLEELVEAFCRYFGYDQQGRASFVSGQEPAAAMASWYRDFLRLEVVGPNTYAWICPGCQEPRLLSHDHLYAFRYDFDFWQLCSNCARPAEEGEQTA
jgi:hypothetical protein